MVSTNTSLLIAPCGMNCGICFAFLRDKNKCPGCRGSNDKKPVTRVKCGIKTCKVFSNGKSRFCFQCADFPCDTLKHLDKRYRTKYDMSMIDNLASIKKFGIRHFLKDEKVKWICAGCGGTVCVHKGYCADCGKKK